MRIFEFAVASLFAITTVNAVTTNLISNGGFETGDISGWSNSLVSNLNVTGSCNNGFAAQSTSTGCATGTNPASGSFAAYSSTSFPSIENDSGEWDNFLRQIITVPYGTITSAILTWDDTANWAGKRAYRGVNFYAAIMRNGLYLTGGLFSVANPTTDGSSPWTSRSLDITSLLQAHQGETLAVDFGSLTLFSTQTANSTSATAAIYGLDNAQLNVIGPALSTVPEPATFVIAALVLGAFCLISSAKFRL